MQAQNVQTENHLSGKIVLITGAGRGLGRELALAFAAQGAIVAANDLTPINLDETVAQIEASGGQVQPYLADIASKLAVQTLLHAVQDDWGRIDILVNHAQVRPRAVLLELDEWDWRRALDVNLTGAFLLLQSLARIMRTSGGGQMLNLVPLDGPAVFAASKAGLAALTRQAAAEFGAYNIQVNAICPLPAGQAVAGLDGIPADLGRPATLGELAVGLCQPQLRSLTGQVIAWAGSHG